MECNVYIGDYRAVKISGKWRITKRNPDVVSKTKWLFVDEIEYDTSSEALEKYI